MSLPNLRQGQASVQKTLYNARRPHILPLPRNLGFHTQPSLVMKVVSSVGSAKNRHSDCQIVKRRGTIYVICKTNPKFKVRQGRTKGTKLSKKGIN